MERAEAASKRSKACGRCGVQRVPEGGEGERTASLLGSLLQQRQRQGGAGSACYRLPPLCHCAGALIV